MMTHSPQIGSSSNPLEILTQYNNSSCENVSSSGVLQNNVGGAQHIDLQKKDHSGGSHLVIQVEEPQYFSPKNFPQQMRKRTDSYGYFQKSHVHLMASHGGNSTNTQIHLNFGEQPPFYQNLAGQNQTNLISQLQGTSNTNQNDQISAMANAGAISISHGSSSLLHFNSNLINMEPFSTQHISQTASVAHSNMQSPKGSCNSDDSLSNSPDTRHQPFTTQSHIPHFPGTFRNIESTLSVFSRQSTNMFKSTQGMLGGGVTTSASIACNESGPIRNRDYSHIGQQWVGPLGHRGIPQNVNAVAEGNDRSSKEFDDLEFTDETLDSLKMPVLQINIQNLQNNLIINLKPKLEERKEQVPLAVGEATNSPLAPGTYDPNDSPSPYHKDTRERNDIMNPQAQDENYDNFTLTHSISSTNLVIPSNLGQPLVSQNQAPTTSTLVLSQVPPSSSSQSSNLESQQTYHTLSIQPTIWSAQVPVQTNQEFLFTQSQMMNQYQQNNVPPQIDIQPHQITLSNTPHVGGNTGSGVATASSASSVNAAGAQGIQNNNIQTTPISSRMGIPQTNYVENQNMTNQIGSQNTNIGQFDVNASQTSAVLYKQSLDMMGAAAAVQHAQDSLNPQLIHQQFQGAQQQSYQTELQPTNIVIAGQQHADQLQQQQITQQQQVSISQIINSQIGMNGGGGPAIQPQQQNLTHFVSSPQIQQQRQPGMQQLTQQDIIEAQMMSNPQQQIYHQLQQQLNHRQSYSQKSQMDPQQQMNQAFQLQQSFNDDPFNLHHFKHNMQISNSFLNRQINRYMQNPLSKTKDLMQDTHHKIAQQSSFRANTSSPELLLQFRPPPGYEHVVPTKVLQQLQPLQLNQQQQQLLLEQQMQIQDFGIAAYQLQQHQQQQQQAAATNAQQWQQFIIHQQQVQQQQQHQQQQHKLHQQHQQQQQLDHTSAGSMMDPYLIQQHLQQQQQLQHNQNLQEFNKYFFNFGHLPQNNQVYMSFYDAQIQSAPPILQWNFGDQQKEMGNFQPVDKDLECCLIHLCNIYHPQYTLDHQLVNQLQKLDEQLRKTAQHLDHKLQENMELQQESLSDDQLFLEDEQQMVMVNNSLNPSGQQALQTTFGVITQQQQLTQGSACISGQGGSSNPMQQQLQQQIGLIQQQPQINGPIISAQNVTILPGEIAHPQTSAQANTQRFISENNHNTLSSSSSSLCSKDEDLHQNILNKPIQSSIIEQQMSSNSSTIEQQQVMRTEEVVVLESSRNHQMIQQQSTLSNSSVVNELIESSTIQETNLLSNRSRNNRSSTQNRDHKETKEKIEAFQKLREQLAKIKSELFYNPPSEASTSASGNAAGGFSKNLTPFKCDPSNYFEKLLNLLRIINEVDNNNNIALLRNEHEKAKSQLERVKGERKKANNELSQLQIEMIESKAKIQDLTQEIKEIHEKHLKEREQHEILIKYSQEQIHKDTEAKESLQERISELTLQLENQKEIQKRLESAFDIPSLNVNSSAGNLIPNRNDQEQMKQFQQEYGKKMMQYEVEVYDLREYIKKRAIEAQIIKQTDKVFYENQIAIQKEAYDSLKKQTDKIIKDRDSEIRLLQEKVMSYDPDYFTTSTLKECADCKKKDQKLLDAESRIRQYTDYIKSKNDRMISAEKQKELEEEISRLRTQMRELCGPSKQSTNNNNYIKKIEKLMQIILCVQQLNKGSLSPQLNYLIKDMVVIHQLEDSPVIQRLIDGKQISESEGAITQSFMPNLNDSLIDLLTLYLQFPSQPIQPVAPPQPSKSEQEKQLFEKMQFASDMEVWSKETVKEGRVQREASVKCIIEVEKLMYKMNKELITEQENLEKDSSNPAMKHPYMASRIEENKRNSELFSKILEGYLELPHKLKPIFDKQKKYEQLFIKMSKADTQLLFEITSQVYDINRGELHAIREEMGLWQQRCQEQANMIVRQSEDIEKQRDKIIEIQGKNVQLKSAYNALEKHLYSIPGGSTKLNQSYLNQLAFNSQTLTKNNSSSSLSSCDSQQMIKMTQNYSSTQSQHEERQASGQTLQQFQQQPPVNK